MNNFWDQKFNLTPNLYGEKPNQFIEKELKKLPPGKILLPGEGEGRNALFAASSHWQVTAIDQSSIAKKHALKKAYGLGLDIDYQVTDIRDFHFEPETYDVVALIYFHLPENMRAEIHQKSVDALKKGGSIFIEGFGKDQLNYQSGGPKDIQMLYNLDDLKASFQGISWSEEFDGILDLDEGLGHKGAAHVIRLKGTKNRG
jgi:2-polyprenyl-3-methyl-5-hydroxy-6-metoxy-1,4-benzoquinol methylase